MILLSLEASKRWSTQPLCTLGVSSLQPLGVAKSQTREQGKVEMTRRTLFHGFMKVKGAMLVPAFFFLVLFLTALPGNSSVAVLIHDEMVGWHHRLGGQEFEQAVRVGWTGRPGVLQSVGSQRVRHD